MNETTKNEIWTLNAQEVDIIFNKIFKDKFKLKYQYKIKDLIGIYIKRLALTTYEFNKGQDKDSILKYINEVEDFFVYSCKFNFINENNINDIIEILTDEFKILKFLPENLRGLYGRATSDVIEINPNLNPRKTTLYMIHEIGHKILNVYSYDIAKKYFDSFDKIIKEKGITNYTKYSFDAIYNGFLLIEEALAQELGEILSSKIHNQKRPEFTTKNDIGCQVRTNFDYYGILQEPTIELGKTLRGVGGNNNQEERILSDMLIKCFYINFSEDLIKEYNEGEGWTYLSLYYILGNMGNIINEKYASLNLQIFPSMNKSIQQSLNEIKINAKKCYDTREYPEQGFRDIDFSTGTPRL